MKDYFDEIVGYEDIKRELRLISDMLNNPDIYEKLGAGINEGMILCGKPGTGKTTMAECLIKSLNRTVFVCRKKASDGKFVKTITDTFEEAKRNVPSVILLDDMDKFSDQYDPECESAIDAEELVTVQSCIDEIKGMDIFVIATVNNIRKIPDSLIRPGRLGKLIRVRKPKYEEIIDIIKHYLAKKALTNGIDEIDIARMLIGESCATMESVINSAAMKAAFNRQNNIEMHNIIDACLDVIFEAPEKSALLSENTRKKIAYHEAGHAVISEVLDPGSVSIISIRETNDGNYGFVRYYRSDEKEDFSLEYNENILKSSLGGRAATELIYGETDMGSNSDLHNAFSNARCLVDNNCIYGFQNWIEDMNPDFVAENRNRAMAILMEKNYMEAKRILANNRDLLEKLKDELLAKTTLVYSDIRRICHS
ncbi:AAA family ATPase [Oribacterium sp. WCC10]|uniref:AAA family ATPase n=1 Tax=Oribacterium sp. WCC10 TaxID=1855343 RepID=UPI0008EF0DCF|nr:AAA family ATPase [Oribacterium sp. WCC10]SFG54781.1 cell division protease FtsH [Oribacterium sp. WCC10]